MELYVVYVGVVLIAPRGSYYRAGDILFDTASPDEKGVKLKVKEQYQPLGLTVEVVKYIPFGMDIW